MSYRPEIDGLRAIAVLAVVLYHAGIGCSGGFVGVDVFFVISGFLITSLILKDIERGTYSLIEFWERRSRRIIPALLVVILATLVAGCFILLPTDYSDLGKSAIAQAVFGANIHFWLDSGYFAEPSAEKPLLHTWSLAVEEQFYLFVPLVFWGILKISGTRSKDRALVLFCIAFLLSFTLSVVRVRTHPSSTFFLLPTRAWELLMGSVLALLPVGAMRAPHWFRETICALGIGLILWPVFAYTESTLFPGLAALPPCLGAAFVIWSNTGATTRCSSLLRTRPVVFVGLISYSLYLWHWPLFAYAKYWFGSHVPLSVRLSLLLAGIAFAVLSWRFVETPFRVRKVCGTRRGILTFAGCSLLGLCVLGFVIHLNEGFHSRLSPEARRFAEGKNDRSSINKKIITLGDSAAGRFNRFGDLTSSSPARILVWGDSHAMSAVPAFDSLAREMKWSGMAATRTQQAPLLGFERTSHHTREDALQFNENVIAWLKRHPVKDVFLIGYWKHYTRTSPGPSAEDGPICDPKIYTEMTDALLETIRQIKVTGARPWVLLDVPVHPFDAPQMLARSVMFGNDVSSLCAKPDDSNGIGGTDMETIQKIQQAGAYVIDPRPRFLDATGKFYRVTDGQVSLYSDSNHLTTKGADRFLLPTLREAFASIPKS